VTRPNREASDLLRTTVNALRSAARRKRNYELTPDATEALAAWLERIAEYVAENEQAAALDGLRWPGHGRECISALDISARLLGYDSASVPLGYSP
jgi:hypothetical protein